MPPRHGRRHATTTVAAAVVEEEDEKPAWPELLEPLSWLLDPNKPLYKLSNRPIGGPELHLRVLGAFVDRDGYDLCAGLLLGSLRRLDDGTLDVVGPWPARPDAPLGSEAWPGAEVVRELLRPIVWRAPGRASVGEGSDGQAASLARILPRLVAQVLETYSTLSAIAAAGGEGGRRSGAQQGRTGATRCCACWCRWRSSRGRRTRSAWPTHASLGRHGRGACPHPRQHVARAVALGHRPRGAA